MNIVRPERSLLTGGNGARRRLQSKYTPVFAASLILFVWSFAFDFRGQEGGTWVQLVMAVIAATSFLVFAGSVEFQLDRSFSGVLLGTSGFVCFSSLVAIYHGVDSDRILRIAFPYILACMGIFIGAHAAFRESSLILLSKTIVWAALMSSAFRYIYATQVDKIGIHEMRYQLLSPALPALLAHLSAVWISGKKFGLIDFVVTMFSLIAIVLSVTRSLLVVIIFCIGLAVITVWRVSFSNRLHAHLRQYRIRVFTWALCGGIAAIAVAMMLRRGAVDAWVMRFTESGSRASGADLTTITRIAELTGIWKQVTETTFGVFFGKGFGALYYWDSAYLADWLSIAGTIAVEFHGIWQPTHSLFTSAFLYAGLVGLTWLAWLTFWALRRIARCLMELRHTGSSELLYQGTFYALTIAIYFVQGFSGSPLGERMAGVLMGISLGGVASFSLQRLLAAHSSHRALYVQSD